jgi:hypothetical protein
MNLFSSITLRWWQVSIFKLSMISLGLLVGATWPEIVLQWLTPLIVIFVITTAYLLIIWWRQWTSRNSIASFGQQ